MKRPPSPIQAAPPARPHHRFSSIHPSISATWSIPLAYFILHHLFPPPPEQSDLYEGLPHRQISQLFRCAAHAHTRLLVCLERILSLHPSPQPSLTTKNPVPGLTAASGQAHLAAEHRLHGQRAKGHETKHKTRRHGVVDHTQRASTLPTTWLLNFLGTAEEEVDQPGASEHRGQTGKRGKRENPCPGQACRE